MQPNGQYLVLKIANICYKVRISDVKRLYKNDRPETPSIPQFENHPSPIKASFSALSDFET